MYIINKIHGIHAVLIPGGSTMAYSRADDETFKLYISLPLRAVALIIITVMFSLASKRSSSARTMNASTHSSMPVIDSDVMLNDMVLSRML